MAAKVKRPGPPRGLEKAGRQLWKAILADLDSGWELDARELHLLERACRIEDEARLLEAVVDADGPTALGSKGQTVVHPAILEGRQLKVAQLRLLSSIEIADPKAGASSPASERARRAANARWQRPELIAERRRRVRGA